MSNCYPKHQYFNGIMFTRDEITNYYLISYNAQRMHRYVWEFYNGSIPEGKDVHHKDFNRANNNIDNLQMMDAHEHRCYHGKKNSSESPELYTNRMNYARKFASIWHGSEAGKKWHKENYENNKEKFHAKHVFICKNCGKEFISNRNGFCSNACKSAYRRKIGVDDVTKQCVVCGQEFKSNKYADTKCCSRQCAAQLRVNQKNKI